MEDFNADEYRPEVTDDSATDMGISYDRTVLDEALRSALKLRSSSPRSTEEQKILHMSIDSLYLAMKDINDEIDLTAMNLNEIERLTRLSMGCRTTLTKLDTYISRYERWGSLAQRAVNQSGLGSNEVNQLIEQVRSSINALIDFRETVGRLEEKLRKLVQEIRTGDRQGSVVSSGALDELDNEERWQQLTKELDDIGISRRVMTQNRDFIVRWFQETLSGDLLRVEQRDSVAPAVQPPPGGPEVPIEVKTLLGSYITIDIWPGSTCLALKIKIQDQVGTPPHDQYLVRRGGRWIPENSILQDFGVTRGSVIDLLLPIWGRR